MMINSFLWRCGCWLSELLHFYHYCRFYQWLDGGKNARVFREKSRSKRNENCHDYCLLHPFLILTGTALAAYLFAHNPEAFAGWLNNPGYHGFCEMLYEFTSASANNGSGFEGLGDNTPFWNIACGFVLILWPGIYPSLARSDCRHAG